MKVISFVNEDGGCGKTSLVDATAEILAKKGYKVLLIDASPKCSLTRLKLKTQDLPIDETLYILFNHNQLPAQTKIKKNIWIIPGHQALEDLSGFQYDLLLRDKLSEFVGYDYAIIDTFNNGTLTNAAICASNDVIVPCKTSRDSVEGVRKALGNVNLLKHTKELSGTSVKEILLNIYEDDSSGARTYGELSTNEEFSALFNPNHIIYRLRSFNRYQWNYKNIGVLGGGLRSAVQLRKFVTETILGERFDETVVLPDAPIAPETHEEAEMLAEIETIDEKLHGLTQEAQEILQEVETEQEQNPEPEVEPIIEEMREQVAEMSAYDQEQARIKEREEQRLAELGTPSMGAAGLRELLFKRT